MLPQGLCSTARLVVLNFCLPEIFLSYSVVKLVTAVSEQRAQAYTSSKQRTSISSLLGLSNVKGKKFSSTSTQNYKVLLHCFSQNPAPAQARHIHGNACQQKEQEDPLRKEKWLEASCCRTYKENCQQVKPAPRAAQQPGLVCS